MSPTIVFLAVSVASMGAVAAPSSAGMPDDAILTIAEQSFAEGVALRSDSAKARAAFARAAIAYDDLWSRGHHLPELALNRAHAHQLSGDLPRAIAALHEGLSEARWSRPLQLALENARSAVAYPANSDLANQCRPAAASGIGTRMSPLEAWVFAAGFWVLSCAAIARFAMTRTNRWLVLSAAAMAGLAVLAVMWLRDYREHDQEQAEPLAIVTRDVFLRKGNAEAWAERLDWRLPRGVEARELGRRGGWVQVRLAGGAVGWLPEGVVIGVARD